MTLEEIMSEIESLPPHEKEKVASWLAGHKQPEGLKKLEELAGCWSPEEADEIESWIEQAYERVEHESSTGAA